MAGKQPKKEARKTQVSAEALPRLPLPEAVPVAEALHRNYAGTATWDDIATALESGSKTNKFKYLVWSAEAYGLIQKNEASQYVLTETGRKVVAPNYEGEDIEGRRKAVLTPTILSKFFTDYNGHPLPPDNLFPNVLENKFGIPRERTDEARATIVANGIFASLLQESGAPGSQPVVGVATAPTGRTAPSESVDAAGPGAVGGTVTDAPARDWAKTCFYITPIGDDATETRRHSDMMLKHLVEPVLGADALKLTVVRADKIERSGLITQQILEHIVKSRICIVDLSFGNPNVFYELGVRHVCKLPTVQVIRKGDKIPFDVSQGRTIIVDTSDVYTIMDRFDSARRELKEHVSQILSSKGQSDDNPISVYLPDLKVAM